jgi:hypothetical protein
MNDVKPGHIRLHVNHHPSGNWTLVEHTPENQMGKDVGDDARLWCNRDGIEFYRTLAHRLVKYANDGIFVDDLMDLYEPPHA